MSPGLAPILTPNWSPDWSPDTTPTVAQKWDPEKVRQPIERLGLQLTFEAAPEYQIWTPKTLEGEKKGKKSTEKAHRVDLGTHGGSLE